MIKKLTREERINLANTKTLEELRHMVKVEKSLLMSDFGLIRSIQRNAISPEGEEYRWLCGNSHQI